MTRGFVRHAAVHSNSTPSEAPRPFCSHLVPGPLFSPIFASPRSGSARNSAVRGKMLRH